MELDLSRFEKIVKSPFSRQEYKIVRVSQLDLFNKLGVLPIIIATPVAERMKKISDELEKRANDPEQERTIRQFLIETGVKRPKIWFGEESECPEGQLPASYAGDDIYWLATEVSNFAFDLARLSGDKFFRGRDSADPGPGGPEVRPETLVPSAGTETEQDVVI